MVTELLSISIWKLLWIAIRSDLWVVGIDGIDTFCFANQHTRMMITNKIYANIIWSFLRKGKDKFSFWIHGPSCSVLISCIQMNWYQIKKFVEVTGT